MTSLIVIAGIVVMVLCDLAYSYNWLNCTHHTYLIDHRGEKYNWGELLVNCDEYILLLAFMWAIKRSTPLLPKLKYFWTLIIDFLLTDIYFTIFFNPYFENWDKTLCVLIAICLFILKVVLHKCSARFRKLKVF